MTTSNSSAKHMIVRAFFAILLAAISVTVLAVPNAAYAQVAPTNPDPPSSSDGANNDQANAALTGVGGATGEAARTALSAVLGKLDLWTTPDLTGKDPSGSNWFLSHYRMMRVMGLYILMPMVLIAIIHAVFKASMNMLLKTVFVFLPISIIGTVVAIDLVQILLNVTDDFSKVFSDSVQQGADTFFESVATTLGDTNIPIALQLFVSIILTLVCVALYVVMIVREGSIYIATSFLPIGFALLVWPSTAKWFKRMVEFLFGIILSKLVMLAAISLAIAAITSAAGLPTAGTTGLAVNGGQVPTANAGATSNDAISTRIGNVLSASALLLVVCLAPHMTVRLVANLGIGEMASHAGNALMRPSGLRQMIFFDRVLNNKNNAKKLVRSVRNSGEARTQTRQVSHQEQLLESAGVFRNEQGNYQITEDDLDAAGITDAAYRDELMRMTNPALNPNNASLIMQAHYALAMGSDFAGFEQRDNGLGVILRKQNGGANILMNITDNQGNLIRHHPASQLRRMIRDEADYQMANNFTPTGEPAIRGINIIMPSRNRMDEFAGGGLRGRDRTVRGRRDERNVAEVVWNTRHEYTGPNGEAAPIRVTFRAPAGVHTKVNQPLDPRARERVGGRF